MANSEWRQSAHSIRYSLFAIRFFRFGRRCATLQGLRGGEHFGGVALDLHLSPDVGDPAVRAEQESGPNNPHEDLAVHGFFAPDAIGLDHLVAFIGKERNAEIVLLLELVLRRDRIGGYPQNIRSGLAEFGA